MERPILGFGTSPDSSGSVSPGLSSNYHTNDRYPAHVWVFADTATRIGLSGSFRVPPDYASNPTIVVVWASANVTSTRDAVWDFDYTAIAPGESLDPSTDQESVTVTTAAPTTAWLEAVSTLDLTDANLAPGDLVQFSLFRDGTAADNLAHPALVYGVFFRYDAT